MKSSAGSRSSASATSGNWSFIRCPVRDIRLTPERSLIAMQRMPSSLRSKIQSGSENG
jgi:hypothetical protein